MSERDASSAAHNAQVTPLTPEALKLLADLLDGSKRDALSAVADGLSGRAAEGGTASLRKLLAAYERQGVAGVIRMSIRPDFHRIPMREDYSEKVIRGIDRKGLSFTETRRLQIALLAYRGFSPAEISAMCGFGFLVVRNHLREFDSFGHKDPMLPVTLDISGDASLLRALSASTNVVYTTKRATAVAMWLDGSDIADIASSFETSALEVAMWLKLYERIGLESLFPARKAEMPSARELAAGAVRRAPATQAVANRPTAGVASEAAEKAAAINPQVAVLEARLTKSYTIKTRLNAISQVARGTSLAVVSRRIKSKPSEIAEWIDRYVTSGYQSLAA